MKKFHPARLLGAAASIMLVSHSAHALNPPPAIQIDGGPLGNLELTGAADGLFYAQSGTASKSSVDSAANNGTGTSLLGDQSNGANFGNMEVSLGKSTGVLRFNLELAIYGGTPALGSGFGRANLDTFPTSPLKIATITVAPPSSPITLTGGLVGSLEGYEYTADFNNANIFASDMWYVENNASRGVSASYSNGPLSAVVTFGDGWYTGVFNFAQALVSYTSGNNSFSAFYGGNVSSTGVNAETYAECGGARCTVGEYGSYYINSQLFGAYDTYTANNFNITPEVQYVYAKQDHRVGINQFTSNLGAAVFTDYQFSGTPYLLGGMAEYFSSIGPSNWFLGARTSGVGFELTPTWQYKYLFARVSAGYLHLLTSPNAGYGNDGRGRDVVQGALEGGILF
jgi:hypothetical protein